jgi:hypothetical protein
LHAVDNLNGFAYVMSGFQHAGDWTFITPSQDALRDLVASNYGPAVTAGVKKLAKKTALGYISGLPVIG